MSKLVGEYLKDLSSLTSNQIVNALRDQVILKDRGDYRPIGELLLDAGQITKAQLEEALRQQGAARRVEIERPFIGEMLGGPTVGQPHVEL